MNKLTYIDSNSTCHFHEQFNAALLRMCMLLFDKITYYSSKSSKNAVFTLLGELWMDDKVVAKKISVVSGNSRMALLFRVFFSTFQNIRILLFSPKDTIILYNYNNPLSLWIVNGINKIKKRKIIVCCHGEIELLISDTARGFFFKINRFFLRSFFLRSDNHISNDLYFMVMGDSILNNLKLILNSKNLNHFISVDHPYIFDTIANKKEHTTLNMGVVGVQSLNKGFGNFIEFAKKINEEDSRLKISITGTILDNKSLLDGLNIDLPTNGGRYPVERAEYNERIANLDYILFFYDRSSYKFIASGALFDAIKNRKLIIAISNDYFSYIFKKYGNFGYLVNDVDEMVNLIGNLLENHGMKVDFDLLQNKLSPDIICNDLKSELLKIGFLKI